MNINRKALKRNLIITLKQEKKVFYNLVYRETRVRIDPILMYPPSADEDIDILEIIFKGPKVNHSLSDK